MRSKMRGFSNNWAIFFLVVGAACGAMIAFTLGERGWINARMYIYIGAAAGGVVGWFLGVVQK